MNWLKLHLTHVWLPIFAIAIGGCLLAQPTSAQVAPKQPVNSAKPTGNKQTGPAAGQLRTLVEKALAENAYYSPGQLISRRDVESLFSDLLEKGVTTADDQEDLVETVLPESSYLVSRLKTPAGRAFMKKIDSDPTVYDRLERLSWTPDGRQLIDNFIKAKDGAEKLQHLKTAEQLAKVSKRLAADSRTEDFALPTNKAHTADELIAKLTEVLAAKQAAE